MDRAYTVKEIEDLRQLCRTRWLFGTFFPHFAPAKPIHDATGRVVGYGGGGGGGWSRSYKQEDLDKGTEELVRTYMLAGITAEQICAEHAANVGTQDPHVGTHEK